MCARRSPRHRPSPTLRTGGLLGAFFAVWGRVGLMCAFAVIFACTLTRPASPSLEDPTLLGQPRTVATELGAVDIAAVKVYSAGALVEVHAHLSSTPDELLARPDRVLTPGEFALTLRNKASGAGIGSTRSLGATRPLDPTRPPEDTRGSHWDLAFWVPRAAWPDAPPHLVWPVAQLDVPLQLNRVELSRAALVVRTRDR